MTRAVTLWGFAMLATAMVAYQALGLIRRKTGTLGEALGTLSRSRAGRALALAGWLWLGWHAFVRGGYR